VAQPESRLFRNIKWVNYYSDHDLIAGHLDAYEGVENRRLGEPDKELDILKAFSDHSVYWGSTEMFDGVITDFLAGAPAYSASPRSTHSRRPQSGSPKINHFFDDKSRPLILGHRGVPLLHQENTFAGLRRAVELGIDGVEFDVFKTRDDKIVVFHDEETERLTGVKGRITEMTWDEVSRLRIQKRIDMGDGRFVTYPSEERIPQLEEVLEEFNGKLLMNIEMKAYAPQWSRRHTGTETARIIRRCGAENSVIVTSFDFFMLYYLEQEYPGLHSGFAYDDGMVDNAIGEWFQKIPEISTDLARAPDNQNDISFLNFVLEANAVGAAIGSTLVDVEHSLIDTDTVEKFKEKNMLVGSYTVFPLDTRFVRNPDEDPHAAVRRMVERRVDWMETDDPERLLELYATKVL
jgi:glycerophosphoryl diester phosphodiesterase